MCMWIVTIYHGNVSTVFRKMDQCHSPSYFDVNLSYLSQFLNVICSLIPELNIQHITDLTIFQSLKHSIFVFANCCRHDIPYLLISIFYISRSLNHPIFDFSDCRRMSGRIDPVLMGTHLQTDISQSNLLWSTFQVFLHTVIPECLRMQAL